MLRQLTWGQLRQDVSKVSADGLPGRGDLGQRRQLPDLFDAADIRQVTRQRIGERMPKASNQKVPGIGQVAGQESDTVPAGLEPTLRLGIG